MDVTEHLRAWERKYDPQDVARWREDARLTCFSRDLLKALRNPAVLAELPALLREAHRLECERAAKSEGRG